MRQTEKHSSGYLIVLGGVANLILATLVLAGSSFVSGGRTRWVDGSLLMLLGLPGLAAAIRLRSGRGAGTALAVAALGLFLLYLSQVGGEPTLGISSDREPLRYARLVGALGATAYATAFLFLGGMVWNDKRLAPWRRLFPTIGAGVAVGFFVASGPVVALFGLLVAGAWVCIGFAIATGRWVGEAQPGQSS